jgi:CYTH domain-containing protein
MVNVNASRPSLKYAHIEQERRFLFSRAPDVTEPIRSLDIHDHYLHHTRLRLRSIEERDQPTVYKLGQKIRRDDDSPFSIAHTTMYLSAVEFETLRALPGDHLSKTRQMRRPGVVDLFHGALTGLVLAEFDVGAGPMPRDYAGRESLAEFGLETVTEVTHDERFTGGALAATSAESLHMLLQAHGLR